MTYQPAPIDNSHIELRAEVQKLVEMLARNNHELWAKGRMAEGWTFGDVKDGAKKTTPLLVPYEDLPESEKEYDRQMAVEALKTIVALGGTITV